MLDFNASSERGGGLAAPRVHQQPHGYRYKDGAPVRPAHRPGARRWLLLPAAVLPLVLSGLAAGCSSTPSYCTAATNLKTSVSNLGDVDVAKNGLNSLQT